ncbi:MAG: hypothetical protein JW965_07685 [Bacteroidales bacterium]|nr:hypothetical protein [Bacteroidales bacterium]
MSDKFNNEVCREIRISIIDSADYRFITPGKLLSRIQTENMKILGAGLRNIDLERLENNLAGLRELESLEVYTTADGILHVEADQRDPVMRVITAWGNNYYIDKYGFVIPHSDRYTPRLIVVSGNIEVPDNCIMGESILNQDENLPVRQSFRMVQYVNGDEFWSRFIEQIWINEKGEFELVPRIGEHIVKFGSVEDYEWKFRVLRAFYKEKIAVAGWDKYKEIDMRFKGQLVCTKK